MKYKEYAPAGPLSAFVRCLWTLEVHAGELGGGVQPILPDGQCELIMHFGDGVERLHPGGLAELQPAIHFTGQLTRRLELRPTGRIAVLGVRFHPDGAAFVFRDSQRDLAELTIGVDALSLRLARALGAIRDSAPSLLLAMQAVQHCLAHAIDGERIDLRVRHAVEAIGRSRGRIAVGVLAQRTGMTRRHLERRFDTLVGLSPKRLARITRFQHALRVLDELRVPARGTRTALTCGYADQAHFVREFRELAGCTPGAHLLHRAELTGFFGPGSIRPPPATAAVRCP